MVSIVRYPRCADTPLTAWVGGLRTHSHLALGAKWVAVVAFLNQNGFHPRHVHARRRPQVQEPLVKGGPGVGVVTHSLGHGGAVALGHSTFDLAFNDLWIERSADIHSANQT